MRSNYAYHGRGTVYAHVAFMVMADKSHVEHGGDIPSSSSRESHLREIVEHAAHFLPSQGPITAFVHHNTLHAFEHMPFETAVVEGGKIFGTEPFLPEHRYRLKLQRGRFSPADIEKVVLKHLGDGAEEIVGPNGVGSRKDLWMCRMLNPQPGGTPTEISWIVEEMDVLTRFLDVAPRDLCDKRLGETRHWIMRDLTTHNIPESHWISPILKKFPESLQLRDVDKWPDARWEQFHLNLLWETCCQGIKNHAPDNAASVAGKLSIRPVRNFREITNTDCDEWVNEVLIRFCSAFIDQDLASVSIPERESGFLNCFIHTYCHGGLRLRPWMNQAIRELNEARNSGLSAYAILQKSLADMAVGESDEEEFITQSILALRGFAGMIWQMGSRTDRIAKPVPKGSLLEYLAVRLVLERSALRHCIGPRKSLSYAIQDWSHQIHELIRLQDHPVERRAFALFQAAQVLGWTPQSLGGLDADAWTTLIAEVEAVDGMTRRKLFHLAFEEDYRRRTLSAVFSHNKNAKHKSDSKVRQKPSFQIVCCIDEREESFRRALEELDPDCETMGAAGFFAVAMNYKGAADAHFTPLCPVIINPQHNVIEEVVYTKQADEKRRKKHRRTIGTVTHRVHVGSRTFAGGWLTAVLGSISSVPLITRIMFPRLTARFMKVLGGTVRPPEATRLLLKRGTDESASDHVRSTGYTIQEMAVIVERLLRDIGLIGNFSDFVIICGHGSSSMNNPHEAAHDCGACGGGRGGPNARAFAIMANDPEVRKIVAAQGIDIPSRTVFVGSYHNTCDDSITYYDLETIPSTHTEAFRNIDTTLNQARMLNAHERCRRFESAPLRLTPDEALRHVEGRAEDLSQVRPEYGHATNALCFVGRRAWSRGLFLDRRAFLQSYDPSQDSEDCAILTRILQAVIPVCGGINLEYFFSYVDPTGYGCGTKLPHNITGLLGVMNGPMSDLRTGLPWQMVEIHEPVRLLFIIEVTPEKLERILDKNPPLATLVKGRWVQVATFQPETSQIHLYEDGHFRPQVFDLSTIKLPGAAKSKDWYQGWRDHLEFATIDKSFSQSGGQR